VNATVNGDKKEIPDGMSLMDYLLLCELSPARVVIELNGVITERSLWSETPICGGDTLEIVNFMGGG
jgi:thiamine biosynthesis protein ThiS